jgi:hypothetical protein
MWRISSWASGTSITTFFYSNPWHPLFDAREKSLSSFPIWINHPNLPIEFWLDEGLWTIGKVLGIFITTNKRYKTSNYQFVNQILVDIHPRNGLYESMDIILDEKIYTQQLDYLHLPF